MSTRRSFTIPAWPFRRRRNPETAISLRPKWAPLMIDGRYNEAIREATRRKTGVYALRNHSTGEVLYVGESHVPPSKTAPLRMWKTITHHFHDPTGKFESLGEWTFLRPELLDVSIWTTPPEDAARELEADLIAHLEPAGNISQAADAGDFDPASF